MAEAVVPKVHSFQRLGGLFSNLGEQNRKQTHRKKKTQGNAIRVLKETQGNAMRVLRVETF
jgi:hypothetical protein